VLVLRVSVRDSMNVSMSVSVSVRDSFIVKFNG